ncbi:MAG: methyltransferase, TIGR04325 family [Thiobacillus sp.]|nr:methyltransferase, TIGR04325 family [Thiobacillus sp.]
MTSAKALIRDCLPPLVIRRLQQLRRGGVRFEGDFPSWAEASRHASGYDTDAILAKVLEATLKVKRGEAVYERDSVVFDQIEYVWPVLSGLMWAAARNQGRLSVLDFGGALGSTYFQNRRFLEGLADVRWNVVEQAHYVERGNALVAEGPLRFYFDIATCLAEQAPNVVLLSSVLQYLPDPLGMLDELGRVGAAVLMIDRTPFASLAENRLLVQHVPASIYPASYPMWVFSDSQLLAHLAPRWRVVSRYAGPEGQVRSREGVSFKFEGLLLEAC